MPHLLSSEGNQFGPERAPTVWGQLPLAGRPDVEVALFLKASASNCQGYVTYAQNHLKHRQGSPSSLVALSRGKTPVQNVAPSPKWLRNRVKQHDLPFHPIVSPFPEKAFYEGFKPQSVTPVHIIIVTFSKLPLPCSV